MQAHTRRGLGDIMRKLFINQTPIDAQSYFIATPPLWTEGALINRRASHKKLSKAEVTLQDGRQLRFKALLAIDCDDSGIPFNRLIVRNKRVKARIESAIGCAV